MTYAVSWPFVAWGERDTFWIDNTGKIGGSTEGEPFIQNRTPEMFAEYRAPECPGCYGNQGHNYPCPATKTPLPRPHGLPPGPAFIPAEHLNSRVTLDEAAAIIGGGYVWHAATDYTGAGWVRPHGSV